MTALTRGLCIAGCMALLLLGGLGGCAGVAHDDGISGTGHSVDCSEDRHADDPRCEDDEPSNLRGTE